MEIKLLKDYTSPQGRLFKKGTLIDCDRETYNKLLIEDICKPLKENKKKTKKENKKNTEKDGINK